MDSRVLPSATVQSVPASVWKQGKRHYLLNKAETAMYPQGQQIAMKCMSSALMVVDKDIHGWITSGEQK